MMGLPHKSRNKALGLAAEDRKEPACGAALRGRLIAPHWPVQGKGSAIRYFLVLLSIIGTVTSSYFGLALLCATLIACVCLSRRSTVEFQDSYFGAMIGGIVILAPLVCGTAGVLSSLSIILLFLPWSNVRWFLPVGLVASAWILVDVVAFADAVFATGPEILSSYSLAEILRWFHLSLELAPPRVLLELQYLHGLLLLGAMLTVMSHRDTLRTSTAATMTALLPISLLVGLLQRTEMVKGTPLENSHFWSEQGRVSGLFTDPNAAGVAAVLLILLLLFQFRERHRLVTFLLFGAASVLGLWSGSRTFLLGAGVIAFILLWRWRKSVAIAGSLIVTSSLAGFVFFALHYEESARSFVAFFPPSVARALQTFQPELFEWSSLSRRAFWDISFAIAKDNLITGVGPGSFREFVTPYARILGYPIGLWTDNSNSFYLGVLAETGIIGVFAWLLVLGSLRRAPYASPTSLIAAPLIAILLITGPHIDFAEVGVLVVLALAYEFRPADDKQRADPLTFFAAFLALLTIVIHGVYREQGVYSYESDGEGRSLRWISPHAKLYAPCTDEGEAHLSFRALHENRSGSPITVSVKGHNHSVVFDAKPGAWYPMKMRCYPESLSRVLPWRPHRVPLEVESAHGWSPFLRGQGNDPRFLGIQVREE